MTALPVSDANSELSVTNPRLMKVELNCSCSREGCPRNEFYLCVKLREVCGGRGWRLIMQYFVFVVAVGDVHPELVLDIDPGDRREVFRLLQALLDLLLGHVRLFHLVLKVQVYFFLCLELLLVVIERELKQVQVLLESLRARYHVLFYQLNL